MNENRVVLDASALLALLHDEIGSDIVQDYLERHKPIMCAVNFGEVASKFNELGKDLTMFQSWFDRLGVEIVVFDRDLAIETAKLREKTKQLGLSMGDRACLALSRLLDATAVTADGVWGELDGEFRVAHIR